MNQDWSKTKVSKYFIAFDKKYFIHDFQYEKLRFGNGFHPKISGLSLNLFEPTDQMMIQIPIKNNDGTSIKSPYKIACIIFASLFKDYMIVSHSSSQILMFFGKTVTLNFFGTGRKAMGIVVMICSCET